MLYKLMESFLQFLELFFELALTTNFWNNGGVGFIQERWEMLCADQQAFYLFLVLHDFDQIGISQNTLILTKFITKQFL